MARKATARKSAFVQDLESTDPDRAPATAAGNGPGMWDPMPEVLPAATDENPNPRTSANDPAPSPSFERLARIPLAELHESPLNPRKHYDAAALDQLQDSLLQTGQLTPVVVRPRPRGGYELGAGHRRYRAAKLAVERHGEGAEYRGLGQLLAIVRDLDDRAFIELLNVENLQREDLHALEEAEGFRTLMERAGYDVAKIAARIGRSPRYVYDSLTLLKLTPQGKKLFLAGAFERGHAIELARLAPTDQERALESNRSGNGRIGGLFVPGLADGGGLALDDPLEPRKPVTVRELRHWIDEQIRFKPAAADPVLFPETVHAVATATAEKERVIEITYDHVVPDAARDPKAPRIYGAQAWRSATKGIESPGYRGKDGKPCASAITGVVVIGERRAQAFKVCIAKEKCATHWADWQRERARARRSQSAGGTGSSRSAAQVKRQQQADARAAVKAAEEQRRWAKLGPALRAALKEQIDTLPVKVGGPLVALAFPRIKGAKTIEDCVRRQVWLEVHRRTDHDWGVRNEGPRYAKQLGVDLAKLTAPAPKPPTPKAKPKKKGGAR